MHKRRQASLRRQLLMHLVGPLMLVLALGAAGGMVISRQVGYLVHDQWLLDSAMTLGAQVKGEGGRVSLSLPPTAIQMFEWDRIDHIYWQASTRHQGLLLNNAPLPPPPQPMRPDTPQFYDAVVAGQAVRVVAIEHGAPADIDDSVRIMVAETMHKRDIVADKTFRQWAPLQIAVVMLAGSFIWLAVTRNLGKVDAIAARLGTFEPGSMVPIVDTGRMPAEIVPLADAINRLIGKLSEEQDTQKRFISNAAHQLRTPLAALQVQTERAWREPDPVKRDQALNDMHRAVTRLHHVTDQLLILMRSEQQTEKHLTFRLIDLSVLAREEVERWADRALRKQIDLGYDGLDQGVLVTGERHLLKEMIGNLIDNAIRYTQAGGTVTLILASAPTRIVVEDNGPGIAERERALVLERFYRGAAGDQEEGCGLGLPIATEIAARHGAQLAIASLPGHSGTRVTVAFAGSA